GGRWTSATPSRPKARPVVKRRFWANTPNPNVARARNRPERRMAGIATSAPTGTITRAASGRATTYGTPAVSRWARVVAPNTANTAWHSETWREGPTSSDRLEKIRTKTTVVVAVSNWEPLRAAGATAALVM